jgi:hypothetical protein
VPLDEPGRRCFESSGVLVSLVVPDVLEESCTTRQALERLASKWRVLLIYALFAGPQRHSELRRRVAGITQKVRGPTTHTIMRSPPAGLVLMVILAVAVPRRHCRDVRFDGPATLRLQAVGRSPWLP